MVMEVLHGSLCFRTHIPGWLYQLKYDATTVWENWKGMEAGREPKDSMNHYSFGTFAGWLMDRVAGIRVEKEKSGFSPILTGRLDM